MTTVFFVSSSRHRAIVNFKQSQSGKLICDINWEGRPSSQDIHELEARIMKVIRGKVRFSVLEENEEVRQQMIKDFLET